MQEWKAKQKTPENVDGKLFYNNEVLVFYKIKNLRFIFIGVILVVVNRNRK